MQKLTLISGLFLSLLGLALLAYAYSPPRNDARKTSTYSEPIPAPLETPAPILLEEDAPNPSSVLRLELPTLGVEASVVTLGVLADGTMDAPRTPMEVAWYGFSAKPGSSGNAVFAGHVDFAGYGPAVFYRLRELKDGDPVIVQMEDKATFTYRVSTSTLYDAATAPVQEIVGPTSTQSITLITCEGVFDRSLLEYDKRRVVRAELLSFDPE